MFRHPEAVGCADLEGDNHHNEESADVKHGPRPLRGTFSEDSFGEHHVPWQQRKLFNKIFQRMGREDKICRKLAFGNPVSSPADINVCQHGVWQDCQGWADLQYQCTVHAQMAGLFAAFVFSILVTESPANINTLIAEEENRPFSFVAIPSKDLKATHVICDQIRLVVLITSLIYLLLAMLRFIYVELHLTQAEPRLFYNAYAGIVSNECQSFHKGILLVIFSVPFYIFKYFGMQPVFFISLLVPFLAFRGIAHSWETIQCLSRLSRAAAEGLLTEDMVTQEWLKNGHPAPGQRTALFANKGIDFNLSQKCLEKRFKRFYKAEGYPDSEWDEVKATLDAIPKYEV